MDDIDDRAAISFGKNLVQSVQCGALALNVVSPPQLSIRSWYEIQKVETD